MELVQKFVWDEFPEEHPKMEFRLVYDGELPAQGSGTGGTRLPEKHAIRKVIHKQMKRLWETNPQLKLRTAEHQVFNPGYMLRHEQGGTYQMSPYTGLASSLVESLGQAYDRCGYKFVPLVSNKLKLSCGLDILFLKRDVPGVPLISGGDVDNRLKVLFDGLRMPRECTEIPKDTQKDPDEEPHFFCLMEDDSLITDLSVTTDTLLRPGGLEERHNVQLVIKVTVRPVDFSFDTLFLST